MDRLPAGIFPARAGSVAPVQAAIPGAPAGRLRRRSASLLQRSRQPGRPCHFLHPTGWIEADRMGRLRQAPVRRSRTGPRLSGPLHPSRRHRQQPPREPGPGKGQLPLERLSPPRQVQAQAHDLKRRRVHPALPAARPSRRIPSHPPLRLLANGHRVAKLAQCRLLLAAPTPLTPDPTADYRQRYRCLTGRSLDICPGCGAAMASLGPIPRKAPTWPDTS
ncbi:hypothetical protein BQ8482_800001 [Mesorhizobium delmotii]|uniref:Uncharacterized protein n=1 Tax=Mesorhizobium delmotii TaxID=1631247 RepID=A0A2P9AWJ3_9HYPH|nr:hypothetical protein BQ8482_800001 [Mesorhizobium delmotii]